MPVTIPESVLAGIAALTWSSGLNKGYGSEHACTLYDIAQSQGSSGPSAASSGHTYSSSGSGSCSNGQSYAERCAVFQAAIAGFTFVAATTSSDIDRPPAPRAAQARCSSSARLKSQAAARTVLPLHDRLGRIHRGYIKQR